MITRITTALLLTPLCVCAALLPAEAQKKRDPTVVDTAMIRGTWKFVSMEQEGKEVPKLDPPHTITFQGDKFEVKQGDKVIQAGTQTLNADNSPKTVDAKVSEGEGKGTTMLGIYELKESTLKACFDTTGKMRPKEFKTTAGSGYMLVTMERPIKKGIDPKDASIVYDDPWLMVPGVFAYNGNAYDKATLCIDPKVKISVPDKATQVGRHDQADTVIVFMEKRMHIGAHLVKSVSIADTRKTMGCAVKLEKGGLLIGTFGEYSFLEGASTMRLLVLVPAKADVELRAGLIGGYGGRAGATRPKEAINPERGAAIPALTKTKNGTTDCWLPPTAEDGWHEIPAVADTQRRVSEGLKGNK